MSKCNGQCGSCAACKFRAAKGVTKCPTADATQGLSNRTFDAVALNARGEETDSRTARIAARADGSDTAARLTAAARAEASERLAELRMEAWERARLGGATQKAAWEEVEAVTIE